jgi:hypothetical protein
MKSRSSIRSRRPGTYARLFALTLLVGCGDAETTSDAGPDAAGGASADGPSASDALDGTNTTDVVEARDGDGTNASDALEASFENPDGTSDVSLTGADAADALPSLCCTIDETPTCDCRQVGGTRLATGSCRRECDAVPIVVRRFVDDNGCPTIELSPMSCLDVPDARPND